MTWRLFHRGVEILMWLSAGYALGTGSYWSTALITIAVLVSFQQ